MCLHHSLLGVGREIPRLENSLAAKTAASGYNSPASLRNAGEYFVAICPFIFSVAFFHFGKTIDRAASSTRNIPSLLVLWISLLYI